MIHERDELESLRIALANARDDDCGNDRLCAEAAMRLDELCLNLRLMRRQLEAQHADLAAARAEAERLRAAVTWYGPAALTAARAKARRDALEEAAREALMHDGQIAMSPGYIAGRIRALIDKDA